ncbi:tetratricopeptide repeat protein [Scytonema hofmannii]|uniref:tetratricopeptide repeat protein n=1 Tax=Scytonema hofmannii TaxID=34078 RepID=UPI00034D218E|nr:CHAT domain-containing protein [Scytonema hofmannii]
MTQQRTQQQKILILTAIPHGLRLDREIREIQDAIYRAIRRDLFEVSIRTAVRPQDIRRAIAETHPQIVHFCGHGMPDGSLVLEDDEGNNKPVQPEGLAALFKLHTEYVNCVLLNICYSANLAKAISEHIYYAIGMNQAIGDNAAIAFSRGFYDALGYKDLDNKDIFQRAFDEGLVAIKLESFSEGKIPILEKKISWQSIEETTQKLGKIADISEELPQSMTTNSTQTTGKNDVRNKSDHSIQHLSNKIQIYRLIAVSLLLALAFVTLINFLVTLRDKFDNTQQNCFELATKENKLIVVITRLNGIDNTLDQVIPFVQDQVLDRLSKQEQLNVVVCPVKESVSNKNEAKVLGNKLGAAIIVWGRQSPVELEIQVTTLKIEVVYLTTVSISMTDTQTFENVKDLPKMISLMITFALSEIYSRLEKQNLKAREILKTSVILTELSEPNLKIQYVRKTLGLAYLFLGYLHLPVEGNCLKKYLQDCIDSANLFRKSATIDSSIFQAFIEEAILQEQLGNLDEAIRVYSQLLAIAPETKKGLIARVSRSLLYLNQNNTKKAVEDLKFACQREPNNYEWLSYLGIAQQQAGDTKAAKEIYQYLRKSLSQNQTAKNEVLFVLKNLAKAQPQFQQEIQSVISLLR